MGELWDFSSEFLGDIESGFTVLGYICWLCPWLVYCYYHLCDNTWSFLSVKSDMILSLVIDLTLCLQSWLLYCHLCLIYRFNPLLAELFEKKTINMHKFAKYSAVIMMQSIFSQIFTKYIIRVKYCMSFGRSNSWFILCLSDCIDVCNIIITCYMGLYYNGTWRNIISSH